MSKVERLLVVSPNWLGDAIMALPAVGDLRRAFPGARLMVAARRATADLFRMSPLVDDVIVMQWSGRISGRRERVVDIEVLPGAPAAQQGAGSVHHVAFSVADRARDLSSAKALTSRR